MQHQFLTSAHTCATNRIPPLQQDKSLMDTVRMMPRKIEPRGTRRTPSSFHGYHILRPIKTHGMSHVYKAMYHGKHGFQRPVAIKMSTGDAATETHIHDEARLLATLSAPNLPRVFDTGTVGTAPYFSMEWIEGNSLRTILKKAVLPTPVCVHLMIQLCNALSALHRAPQCLIHSDIKPANIMIHPKGHLTLIDLGISKPSGATRDTSPYGTIAYMAPEQLSLETITPRTDIYSFGVVLFEMLTGRRLYTGKVPEILAQRHQNPRAVQQCIQQDIPQQHRLFLPLLRQCLSLHPHKRPANIETIRTSLCGLMHPLFAQRVTRQWLSVQMHATV